MNRKLRVGVIGFGRMGRGFVSAMQQSDFWDIRYICDMSANARQLASRTVPTAKIVADESAIFADKSLDVVGLFTLADSPAGADPQGPGLGLPRHRREADRHRSQDRMGPRQAASRLRARWLR